MVSAVTNYAAVIRPLQVLVMVVAIVFFARVLRVATVQTRPIDGAPRAAGRRRGSRLGLEFIEPLDREGERVDIDGSMVVGRGSDCDLSIMDTYLSTRHARFIVDNGDLALEDLGSTNGTYINQQIIAGRETLRKGDIVQVGGVLFEVVR